MSQAEVSRLSTGQPGGTLGQPGGLMGHPAGSQSNPRQLAFGVALGQAVVALAAALLCWMIADSRAALSAALGGGISSVASFVMALLSFGKQATTDPLRSAALSAAAVSSSAATTSHTIMKRANIARDPEEVRQLRRADSLRAAPRRASVGRNP